MTSISKTLVVMTAFVLIAQPSFANGRRGQVGGARPAGQTDQSAATVGAGAAQQDRVRSSGTSQVGRANGAGGIGSAAVQPQTSARPAAATTLPAIVREALADTTPVDLAQAGTGSQTLRNALRGGASVATIAVALDSEAVQASLATNSEAAQALALGNNGVGRSIPGDNVVQEGEALAAKRISCACNPAACR